MPKKYPFRLDYINHPTVNLHVFATTDFKHERLASEF